MASPPGKAPAGFSWAGGARVWNGAGYDILNEREAQLRSVPVSNWWLISSGFPAGTPAGLDNVYDVWRYYGEDAARNGDLVAEYGIDHWPPRDEDFEQAGLELVSDPGPIVQPPLPTFTPPLPPPPPVAPQLVIAPAPSPEGSTPVPTYPLTSIQVVTPAMSPESSGSLLSQLSTELAQLIQGTHPEQGEYPELAQLCVGFTQRFGFPALVSTVADLLTSQLGMVVR